MGKRCVGRRLGQAALSVGLPPGYLLEHAADFIALRCFCTMDDLNANRLTNFEAGSHFKLLADVQFVSTDKPEAPAR